MKRKIRNIYPCKFIFTGIIFFTIIISTSCNKGVIDSSAGTISPGSFLYLKYVFDNKGTDLKKFAERIVNSDTEGVLAGNLGFKDDEYFSKYILLAKRSRINSSANQVWKDKFGEKYNMKDIYDSEKIIIDFKRAAKDIIKNRYILKGKIVDLKIGKWLDGDIKVSDIKEVMLPEEWNHFLSFRKEPLEATVKENLLRWISKKVDDRQVKKFKAVEPEILRYDYNRTAKRFLMVKYAFAEEGIYPTKKINIKFTPKELFQHFHKIIHRFKDILSIKIEATIVKDYKSGQEFLEQLKKGNDFKTLANLYGMNEFFRNSGKPFIVKGYNLAVPLKKRRKRSFIDKLALSIAAKNDYSTILFQSSLGTVVIRILEIEWDKRKIDYLEHRATVDRDLNISLLHKSFPIDLMDLRKELDFTIDLKKLEQNK